MSQLSLVQEEVSRLKSELAMEQARCNKLRANVSSASVGHVKVRFARLAVHARAVLLCCGMQRLQGQSLPSVGLHDAPTHHTVLHARLTDGVKLCCRSWRTRRG